MLRVEGVVAVDVDSAVDVVEVEVDSIEREIQPIMKILSAVTMALEGTNPQKKEMLASFLKGEEDMVALVVVSVVVVVVVTAMVKVWKVNVYGDHLNAVVAQDAGWYLK